MDAAVVEETVQVGGLRFTAQVPGKVCPACGENYLSGETLRTLERSVAEALARSGVGTPEAFRYMRKAISLKAVEVAELFAVVPETVSRWENGERQPEPRAVKMLGALVVEHMDGRSDLLDYLRAVGREELAEQPADRNLVVPLQMSLQPG
jgi:putative zinc finger/helix-turn-helix YgiT family protein